MSFTIPILSCIVVGSGSNQWFVTAFLQAGIRIPNLCLLVCLSWKSAFPKNKVKNSRGMSKSRILFNALWNCPKRSYFFAIQKYMPVVDFLWATLFWTCGISFGKMCFLQESNKAFPSKLPPHENLHTFLQSLFNIN